MSLHVDSRYLDRRDLENSESRRYRDRSRSPERRRSRSVDRRRRSSRSSSPERDGDRRRRRPPSRERRERERDGDYRHKRGQSPERRRRSPSRERGDGKLRRVSDRTGTRHEDKDSERKSFRRHSDDNRKEKKRKERGENDGDSKKANSETAVDDNEDVNSSLDIVLEPTEEDVEKVKEESRRRREAIMQKYRQEKKQEDDLKAVSVGGPSADGQLGVAEKRFGPTPGHPGSNGIADAVIDDVSSLENGFIIDSNAETHSAALEGDEWDLKNTTAMFSGDIWKSKQTVTPDSSPKEEKVPDMFSDDMFGESPAAGRKVGKMDVQSKDFAGVSDNWDDAEGYYVFRFGEVLDGRYEVASSHGRGVFSSVVKAWDLKNERKDVAIKIIRSNETMYKAGQLELVILKKLSGADPDDRRHCVRLLSSFEHRGHLCLVFESLAMNLREVLKKFGRNIGINLMAVRAYAMQSFIALKHLRNCGVLHCDIKPDNMLVNESKNVLKLADFGSAMFSADNEITPYLVSRFYRAPEIMLGLPYDHSLDMWSIGCCLYELYTGKMLFPGRNNNDMLRLHIELKGPFPKKLLKKASFVDQHFDSDFNFCAIEEDPVTKKSVKRIISNVKPKDMGSLLGHSPDEDPKLLASFKDLLDKIFCLDPDKRITVSQALSHPFVSGK